jgi:hypothetical protein
MEAQAELRTVHVETMQTMTPGRGPETAVRSDCPLLLSAATKSLFAASAFRILGLPVESNIREISQRADKIKQMEQLGIGVQGVNKAFPLNPPPSFDQVREAIQRLKDPEKRLIDEFFWFWPQQFGQSRSDPAIQALTAGDSQTAIQIWNIKESDPADGVAATHNLAVMWHMTALEFEGRRADSHANSEAQSKIDAQWANALKRWKRLVADDRFWDILNGRVRQVNDLRLSTGFTYSMRRSLPEALFKINGELALEYAEAGQPELARVHSRYVQEVGHGWADAQKTAELVLAPLAKRLKEHIRLAKQRSATTPIEGANAAGELANLAAGSVGTFDLVCGPNSRFRNELFDEVAEVCNLLVVAYFQKTSDAAASLPILNTALQFATLASLKTQIEANVLALQQKLNTITFLKKRQPAHSAGRAAPTAPSSQENSQSTVSSTRVQRPAAEQSRQTADAATARVLLRYFGDPSAGNLIRILNDLKNRVEPPAQKFTSAANILKKLEPALREISPEDDAYWDLSDAGFDLLRRISWEAAGAQELQTAQYTHDWARRFAKTPDRLEQLAQDKFGFQNRNESPRRVNTPRSESKNNSQFAGVVAGCLIALFLGMKVFFQPASPAPPAYAPPSAPVFPRAYPQPGKVASGFPLSLIAIPPGSSLTNLDAANQPPVKATGFQEIVVAGYSTATGSPPIYEIPSASMGELTQDQSRLTSLRKNLEETADDLAREHDRLLYLESTLNRTGQSVGYSQTNWYGVVQSERKAILRGKIMRYNARVNQLDNDYAAYNQLVTNYNAKLKALAVENTGSNFK